MAETAAYYNDCYNAVARIKDAQVKAAESAGNVPMTKTGSLRHLRKNYDRRLLSDISTRLPGAWA